MSAYEEAAHSSIQAQRGSAQIGSPILIQVLWNVKAFTVLMKKDPEVKKEIESFEEVLPPSRRN
jgi:hypothetical protein